MASYYGDNIIPSLLISPDITIGTLKHIIADKLNGNIKNNNRVEDMDKGQASSTITGDRDMNTTSSSSLSSSFSLTYNGKLLWREEATLQDYNIQSMAVLDLGIGLLGGGLDGVSNNNNSFIVLVGISISKCLLVVVCMKKVILKVHEK